MNKFWQTKEGKVFSHAIHEHNSGLGIIVNAVSFLKLKIEKGRLNDEELLKYLDIIQRGKERCKEGMDFAYSKIKEITENA